MGMILMRYEPKRKYNLKNFIQWKKRVHSISANL